MLKRFGLAFAGLFLFAHTALAAGTIPWSGTQQLDVKAKPLANCQFRVYVAGTVATAQDTFQDSGLTVKHPWPLRCDSAGRLPVFYLADGAVKVSLTSASGVPQNYPNGGGAIDNVLVVGPSTGGGGIPSVDPTTIFQTGDVIWQEVNAVRSGWVRDNGRTIGSAASGATERANSDTQPLYEWLYANCIDAICTVTGGRTGNATNDYNANKPIKTPNKQGMIVGGLDGMGATPNGIWDTVPVISGSVTAAGSVIGALKTTLLEVNLPPHAHTGTTNSGGVDHSHTAATGDASNSFAIGGGGPATAFNNNFGVGGSVPRSITTGGASAYLHTHGFTTGNGPGTSTPFYNTQRTVLGTFFRKL